MRTSLATEGNSLGDRHSTAVDDVFGAGDGRSARRGEERNKIRDFSRFRRASNGDATQLGARPDRHGGVAFVAA